MVGRESGGKGNDIQGVTKFRILEVLFSSPNSEHSFQAIYEKVIEKFISLDKRPSRQPVNYRRHLNDMQYKHVILVENKQGAYYYRLNPDTFENFKKMCEYIIQIKQLEEFTKLAYFKVSFSKYLRDFIRVSFNKEIPSTTLNNPGMNTLLELIVLSETALTLLITQPEKFSGLKEFFIWEQDNYYVDKHPEESMPEFLYSIHQAIEGLIPIIGMCIKMDLINEYVVNGSSSDKFKKLKQNSETYSDITHYDLRILNEFYY